MENISKLAHEKGFKAKTFSTIWTFQHYAFGASGFKINDTCDYLLLCEIQKWMREELNVYISVITDSLNEYTVIINDKLNGTRYTYTEELDQDDANYHTFQDIKQFTSYEEALMAGIKETLRDEKSI